VGCGGRKLAAVLRTGWRCRCGERPRERLRMVPLDWRPQKGERAGEAAQSSGVLELVFAEEEGWVH